ncbi:MAG: 23S rRNA (pseudouridine(1915)-N(3))-methyltransferase RlmH [Alphaproteobacteria bacterium]|nr:23S rRNA (pseudouridine(1915)-N(3))-methyltransferase RlmH [Alphaproteobacteria bacterium]
MKLHLIAIGRARGAYADLCAEYGKRIKGGVTVRELATGVMKTEGEAIERAIPEGSTVILMDENGKDLTSRELAVKLAKLRDQGAHSLAFVIGGADGLAENVRKLGSFTLSLGKKTWPHMMARAMLMEQIYRAQQINDGHPYHRD